MKHITKHTEPASFTAWKLNNPTATYKEDLKQERAIKQELKKSLIDEQHGLCCYCECTITKDTSHIEHFKPKGNPLYSNLQLDYNNLHASCGFNRSGKPEEHCGHKKYDEFVPELISPLEPDCSTHFAYTLFGEIKHTTNRGKITIELLNLNSELLKEKRRNLIDFFLSLDDSDFDFEVNDHLDTSKPIFGQFYTMIEYLTTNKMF